SVVGRVDAGAGNPHRTDDVRTETAALAGGGGHRRGCVQPPLVGLPADGRPLRRERAARRLQPLVRAGEGMCGAVARRRTTGIPPAAAADDGRPLGGAAAATCAAVERVMNISTGQDRPFTFRAAGPRET